MKIDYIVIAGSSGGHILPSISLINQLAKLKKKSYPPIHIQGVGDAIPMKYNILIP